MILLKANLTIFDFQEYCTPFSALVNPFFQKKRGSVSKKRGSPIRKRPGDFPRPQENLTPYLLPQECGNRTGVRWAEITDAAGRGLRIFLNGGEFSALPWTPHELENAAHGFELPPVCYTVLKMSARQMGVGGDNSWGARTLDEYLLDVSQPLVFRFALEGC